MKIWRIILAVVGIGIGTYGLSQLLTQIPRQTLVLLALWLIGALIIHDGLLSPAVVGVGAFFVFTAIGASARFWSVR